jgi:hypothetical protein
MVNGLNVNTVNRARGQGPRRSDIRLKILEILQRHEAYDMEKLVEVCPSFTWNQVFLEVDHLSRTGEVRLMSKEAGVYTVTRPVAREAHLRG